MEWLMFCYEQITVGNLTSGEVFNFVDGIIQSGTLTGTPITTSTLYTTPSTTASSTSWEELIIIFVPQQFLSPEM
jgi:hypothetical protein